MIKLPLNGILKSSKLNKSLKKGRFNKNFAIVNCDAFQSKRIEKELEKHQGYISEYRSRYFFAAWLGFQSFGINFVKNKQ